MHFTHSTLFPVDQTRRLKREQVDSAIEAMQMARLSFERQAGALLSCNHEDPTRQLTRFHHAVYGINACDIQRRRFAVGSIWPRLRAFNVSEERQLIYWQLQQAAYIKGELVCYCVPAKNASIVHMLQKRPCWRQCQTIHVQ